MRIFLFTLYISVLAIGSNALAGRGGDMPRRQATQAAQKKVEEVQQKANEAAQNRTPQSSPDSEKKSKVYKHRTHRGA